MSSPYSRGNKQELSDIVAEFSDGGFSGPRKENNIVYDDFVDMLVVASPSTSKLRDRGVKAPLKVEERILKMMLVHYVKNPKASRLRTAFRRHDKNRTGTVQQSQWVVVLRETQLSSVMTRKVAEAICAKHDTRADGNLDYASFCDDIFAGDFDHYAHQQHFVYKDPTKDSNEDAPQENNEDADWATSSDGDERPECDDSLRCFSGSRSGSSSRVSTGTPGGGERGGSNGGGKGITTGKSKKPTPKRRMSLSMVLPEGPVRGARYQPPPTTQMHLDKMNLEVFDFHGDTSKQLARAMKAFSSSFARTNRRKLLRKHFLAFDVNSTGKISKEQFTETVHEVACEFFIDFDDRDKKLLAYFFFPKEHGRIKYETLLEIITARDVRRAYAFRQQTAHEGADMDELFTGIDTSARERDFGGTLNLFATAC